jgi:homoserine kinase type II
MDEERYTVAWPAEVNPLSRDLICLMCPNGCHLTLDPESDRGVRLQGHGCDRAFDFARILLDGEKCSIAGKERSAAHSDEEIRRVVSLWGIALAAVHPDLVPDGSPERTLFRVVIEDETGMRFVLEQIPASSCYAKMRIIRTLEFLSEKGLSRITPYLADSGGKHIQTHGRGLWQLSPFVQGIPLDRRTYLHEGWRAEVLSRFLIELREKSRGIPFYRPEESFSLRNYIVDLVRQIEKHATERMPRIRPVVAFLEKDFMGVHDRLPVGFCHGDYHPLNIIWGEGEIRSVIDWEFAGMKPEIYDLANLVGCLGMEHPHSLAGNLVVNLISRLKAAGIFSEISWGHFHEFVVALRFAWLSEWLRREDREMVDLELEYMDLLIQNREPLREEWAG